MAKSSLNITERYRGRRGLGMTRRVGPLRNKHRSQTGLRRCKDQNVIGGPFVVIEEATTLPGWKEISPPKGVLVEGVIPSKVIGSDGELCRGHPA